MMGRPRKPLSVKEMQGTVERAREAARGPRREWDLPVIPVPPPPSDLPPHVQDIWERTARSVNLLGVYTSADEDAFRLLILSLAAVERFKDGAFNPFAGAVRLAQAGMARFGLSPADRERFRAPAVEEPAEESKDPLDEFASKGPRLVKEVG